MTDVAKDALPRLMLIADGFAGGRRTDAPEVVQERAACLVEAGVELVQLRDHAVDVEVFAAAAERLAQALWRIRTSVRLIVNTHLNTSAHLGAGGHVGMRGPTVAAAREQLGAAVLLGYSAHTGEDAARAARDGADYLLAAPIHPTASKPGHVGIGLDGLRRIVEAAPGVPVYGLGGITLERAAACRAAGAYGVAVLSALLDATDPEAIVHDFNNALHP